MRQESLRDRGRMGPGSGRLGGPFVALALVGALLPARLAGADEVTFKGNMLRGTVKTVTASGIEFAPEPGTEDAPIKGLLAIPYEYVEHLSTDAPVHVLHGEEQETVGRLVGVRDGALLVGDDPSTAQAIAVETIQSSVTAAAYEESALSRLRSQWRYWHANFDLGFGLTQSTVDTTGFGLGLAAKRDKAPTRFRLESGYRYATQDEEGSEKKTTEDELRGLLRGDYDLTDRLFTFASADGEYDGIEDLSIRAVPKLGLGYFLYRTKTADFSVESGGAYVYERFFGGDTNDFFSIVFGKEINAPLPLGTRFHWRTDYLPAVEDFAGDWLLRTDLSLLYPMTDFFAFKTSLLDEYDSTPAKDTKHNKLSALLGLSLLF